MRPRLESRGQCATAGQINLHTTWVSRKSKNGVERERTKGCWISSCEKSRLSQGSHCLSSRHKHQPDREEDLRLLPISNQKSVDQPMRRGHDCLSQIICICRRDRQRSCLNFTSSNGHFRSLLSLFTIESKYSQTPITFMADWKHKDKGMKNVSASRETMSLNLSCITDGIPLRHGESRSS